MAHDSLHRTPAWRWLTACRQQYGVAAVYTTTYRRVYSPCFDPSTLFAAVLTLEGASLNTPAGAHDEDYSPSYWDPV